MPNRRTVTMVLASAVGGVAALDVGVPGTAQAQEKAAASATSVPLPPAEVTGELPGAVWTGAARMRFFAFSVYDAALWVAPGFSAGRYAQSAFALQLHYLRSLEGHAIAHRSLAEMRRAAMLTPAQEQRWLLAMQESFPDVKAGDRLTGLHQPGVGARFWFNGAARPGIADPEFSRLFFGIWLADSTSEPRLRTALLAKAAP